MLKKTAELVGTRPILTTGSKFLAIRDPTEFYETLRAKVKTSKDNITLSALYLGCGKLEFDLIHDIEKALSDPKRPNLKVTVILDHSRALRGDVNSATICSKIIKSYPDRFSLLLYQVPQLRNFWSKCLPGQVREVLGVYHCKFNVFDDCAILTGANLSNDYFTDRQDRYLQIADRHQPSSVVKYLEEFTSVLVNHCHRVTHSSVKAPTAEVDSLAAELKALNAPRATADDGSGDKMLKGSVMFPVIQHTMIGVRQEKRALLSVIGAVSRDQLVAEGRTGPSQIKIATPYTSFKSSLMQALIRSGALAENLSDNNKATGAKVCIINPSAQAHGFAGASGVKSLVPKLHQCAFEQAIEDHSAGGESEEERGGAGGLVDLLRWMLSCIVKGISSYLRPAAAAATEERKVLPTIYEFSRGHWSFHTKGIWFYPPEQAASLPSVSYIGSSNFGARSWTRDFELGFILASEEQEVRGVMHSEYQNIEQWCSREGGGQQGQAFRLSDSERLWLPAVTRLVKSFL